MEAFPVFRPRATTCLSRDRLTSQDKYFALPNVLLGNKMRLEIRNPARWECSPGQRRRRWSPEQQLRRAVAKIPLRGVSALEVAICSRYRSCAGNLTHRYFQPTKSAGSNFANGNPARLCDMGFAIARIGARIYATWRLPARSYPLVGFPARGERMLAAAPGNYNAAPANRDWPVGGKLLARLASPLRRSPSKCRNPSMDKQRGSAARFPSQRKIR